MLTYTDNNGKPVGPFTPGSYYFYWSGYPLWMGTSLPSNWISLAFNSIFSAYPPDPNTIYVVLTTPGVFKQTCGVTVTSPGTPVFVV